LIDKVNAFLCLIAKRVQNSSERIRAVKVNVLELPVLRNKVKVKDNFREGRINIDCPISGSISNNETLKIINGLAIPLGLKIVLMDLPRKIWHVDTSVAFS